VKHSERVAVYCSVLQCVAVCRSVSQCVAACCSVFQCINRNSTQFLPTPNCNTLSTHCNTTLQQTDQSWSDWQMHYCHEFYTFTRICYCHELMTRLHLPTDGSAMIGSVRCRSARTVITNCAHESAIGTRLLLSWTLYICHCHELCVSLCTQICRWHASASVMNSIYL